MACTYNMVISSLSLLGHHRPQLLVTIVTSETTRFTFTWRDPCLGDLLNALQLYCKNQPKKFIELCLAQDYLHSYFHGVKIPNFICH